MAINLKAPEQKELRPRITVLGVGGAGGNAVNNMIGAKLEGVEFVVANTDAQALAQSKAERKIQIGAQTTEGLGAGAQPDVGKAGAEESLDEILEQLAGSHMVFITAGMGGGTGTGAAPVIARAVRELGILTVGVVTKPFAFEGDNRMRIAERGILELQQHVHTLIVIPNQNLFRVANDRTTFAQAFAMADEVLHSGVRGVTDLIVMPGLINLDFADIKAVISEMGKAMMGTGEAEGESRAEKAADMAICNPLLDDVSMKGARGVLINITGGPDLMLFEVEQAANRVRAEVDPDARIIFGSTILDNMEGRIRVSVVATGIDAMEMRMPRNVEPLRPKLKPVPFQEAKVDPIPQMVPVNPVMRQQEALAAEMNAVQAEPSPIEDYILGGADAPMVEEEVLPAVVQPQQPMRIQQRQPEPQPQPRAEPERRGWFLRKKPKEDLRMEPAPAPVQRATIPPRANAQVMTRSPAPAEQIRQADNSATDLFPDHKRDEQFEIPAFLRRQSN
ncbi:MAG TPA: cell division protein FtsZ [Rhizomicrobium sp.]|nr:cell division protein FtsZ [Rhizomicrobium sp.]